MGSKGVAAEQVPPGQSAGVAHACPSRLPALHAPVVGQVARLAAQSASTRPASPGPGPPPAAAHDRTLPSVVTSAPVARVAWTGSESVLESSGSEIGSGPVPGAAPP